METKASNAFGRRLHTVTVIPGLENHELHPSISQRIPLSHNASLYLTMLSKLDTHRLDQLYEVRAFLLEIRAEISVSTVAHYCP